MPEEKFLVTEWRLAVLASLLAMIIWRLAVLENGWRYLPAGWR